MKILRRWTTIAVVTATASYAWAQPALTTIQDTLFKADGTRYSGTVSIRWTSFQTGDNVPIATQQVTLQIVNGSLKVKLVPTTTASAGANYAVNYSSQGKLQFSESWAVPPSSSVLRLRDVRVSSGTVVGPPAVSSPIFISDVTGLTNELTARPQVGSSFGPSRAAVINFAGQIDAAAGNPGDCVRVDGSAGPCGGDGGGILPAFVDTETPAGLINGINLVFTLNSAPSPAASLQLYRNGMRLKLGLDFLLNGNVITFFVAAAPQSGDALIAEYRYADSTNPLGSLASPQVICSSTGTSSSSINLLRLGSCTFPAGLLKSGDRISVSYHFGHTGTDSGFAAQVVWGATAVFSRSLTASESEFAGRFEIGLNGEGAAWSGQEWGKVSTQVSTIGSATDNFSGSITLDFLGHLVGTSADSVTLRSFTVTRYPAQANP